MQCRSAALAVAIAAALTWSCGTASNGHVGTTTYTIGGSVSGLIAGGLVLQESSLHDTVTVAANATSYTFATARPDHQGYTATIQTQPTGQTCTLANATGIVSSANVTNINVTCGAPTYSIGGTVTGLSGTVVLQNNGGDDKSISADGAFTFTTALASNATYNVTVVSASIGNLCTASNGTGTVSGANVTNVAVSCVFDSTPPTVVSKTPASSAGNVALDATITVTFSEAMNQGSLTTGYSACTSGFRLTTTANMSTCVAGTFSFSGATLTFMPSAPLAYGTFYTVFILNSVKDLAGNGLGTALSWGFSALANPTPAPTNLVATPGDGSVGLTWTTVSGASGYYLYRSTTGSVAVTAGNQISSGANTPFTDTAVTNGTTYSYVVTAVKAGIESGPSNLAVTTPTTPPTAPTSLSATGANKQINLTWTAGTGATSNKVYRSTSPGVTVTLGNQAGSVGAGLNAFSNTGLTANTKYYYMVTSVNAVGESGPSNETNGTTAPAAPTLLNLTPSGTQITLSWTAAPAAASYNAYRSASSSVAIDAGHQVTSGVTGTSYPDTGLANGTTYYYAVTAVNSNGEGDPSNMPSARTVPAAPTLVSLSANVGQVIPTWTASPGATSYNLYYGTSSTQTSASHGTALTGIGSGTRIVGLTPGTTYYFTVTALNAAGESVESPTPGAAPFGITAVSSEANQSLALRSDGTLWELGTIISTHVPVQVGSATNWTAVSAGGAHFLALKSDGTLWAWGSNSNGQLGDGTTGDKTAPVQAGTDTDWTAISAGRFHSLALKSGHTLWAWGRNSEGQLGDNSTTERHAPVQAGTDTDWTVIAAGWLHSLALKSGHTLWAWGYNVPYQLGFTSGSSCGGSPCTLVPTQVGSATAWAAIAAGSSHSLGLQSDNSLWAWGWNGYGQLGVVTATPTCVINTAGYYCSTTPVQVGSALTWVAIAGGQNHSLGVQGDGTVWAWGDNTSGALGDGTVVTPGPTATSPKKVGLATDWASVAGGAGYSLARKTDGTLWDWGLNGFRLSDGTITDRYFPVLPAWP